MQPRLCLSLFVYRKQIKRTRKRKFFVSDAVSFIFLCAWLSNIWNHATAIYYWRQNFARCLHSISSSPFRSVHIARSCSLIVDRNRAVIPCARVCSLVVCAIPCDIPLCTRESKEAVCIGMDTLHFYISCTSRQPPDWQTAKPFQKIYNCFSFLHSMSVTSSYWQLHNEVQNLHLVFFMWHNPLLSSLHCLMAFGTPCMPIQLAMF